MGEIQLQTKIHGSRSKTGKTHLVNIVVKVGLKKSAAVKLLKCIKFYRALEDILLKLVGLNKVHVESLNSQLFN